MTIASASDKTDSIYIPERFVELVLAHIYMAAVPWTRTPVLIGIQGPSGDGKSYQCRVVASRHGVDLTVVSASELANELEAKPVEMLRQIYIVAGTKSWADDRPSAILIDDFDMGIAAIREGSTYTVNSQLLTSFLMNLCDDPSLGGTVRRPVPIIITGNNLAVLHGPLRRHGRIKLFEWVPTSEERAGIAQSILGSIATDSRIRQLLEMFDTMPISFFAQVANEIKIRTALRVIRKARAFLKLSEFEVAYQAESRLDLTQSDTPQAAEFLLTVASEIRASHVTLDYLKEIEPKGDPTQCP